MSGYVHCACRDCFELAVAGEDGLAFCDGCDDAGCPDYQGHPGCSQECQRPDAYSDGESEEQDFDDHNNGNAAW